MAEGSGTLLGILRFQIQNLRFQWDVAAQLSRQREVNSRQLTVHSL